MILFSSHFFVTDTNKWLKLVRENEWQTHLDNLLCYQLQL